VEKIELVVNEQAARQGKTCATCRHHVGQFTMMGKTTHQCILTPLVLNGTPCQFYDKDISDEHVCFNCEHFLSNAGDWGLSCAIHYHMLCQALSTPCDDFVKKEGSQQHE